MRSSSSEMRVEWDVSPNDAVISKGRLQSHSPFTCNMHRAAAQTEEPSRCYQGQECAILIQCSQLGLRD